MQMCLGQPRLDSKVIDASVSYQLKSTPIDTRSHWRKCLTGELTLKKMLHYKAIIIIIEGNDVASGLKWAW